ncbi:MAG: 3-hydroxyacyl-ACP dehydratase FabZ [Deltaproteobacteria bacterium]|nr:3-hydroxyacyl-ACP dehydratase FabZ [Deltaproteobacteria bacterium]
MSRVDVDRETIERILPHRPPFLFVDRVRELDAGKRILADLELRPEEPHFSGHFPGRPIMPGVLIAEALAQTSGLLLALSAMERGEDPGGRMFYLARADVKWTEPAEPGQTLELEAQLQRELGPLVAFKVRAFTKRVDVASGTLTLARVSER